MNQPKPGTEPAGADATLAHEMLRSTLNLAALGSLMRAFAHDGNNHLMVIMSCLEVLSLDTVDEHDRGEALALATGASRQLADALSALLTGARAQVARPQRVELGAALQTAVELYGCMTPRAKPVALGSRATVWVHTEPSQLQLAMLRMLLGADRLGANAVTASIATIDVDAPAADLPPLRKGCYAGVDLECVGSTLPQRLARGVSAPGPRLDLLRDPDGLGFAAIEAYAQSMRGALQMRPAAAGHPHPRMLLLLPLQE